ncbi:diguanylate cyclase [Catellatospora bangladeshensis]|uniref:Diguanylate cyclase n=1 Tax=Catellatospora bangladeshensis TaxID=310355 RepID=A0A8J3JSA7_9ACTN|nr:sensor domain-containing diguanylate cyclase [Catellatospora bangladeshensis]GIF84225.1 hypothetical protein Cba03nite_55740 [Catellatospora bangladeshensis]
MRTDIRRYFTRLPWSPGTSRPSTVRDRFARVGPRLTLLIVVLAALLPLLGLLAEREQRAAGVRGARAEAQQLAEVIAHDVGEDAAGGQETDPARLRQHLEELRAHVGGDIEIVDLRRNVLAATMPEAQSRQLGADAGGQIAATIRDGLPRVISHDAGQEVLSLVVVPIRTDAGIVGAVLLDYTDLTHDLLDSGATARRNTIIAALGGMAVALALGWALSRGLVHDLRRLTAVAHRYAEGEYDVRAEVSSRGEVRELAAAFNTMAERIAERRAVLTDLATTDALTGLHNRRAFRTSLARDLARAERGGDALALLIMDLDHFKAINDEYGHLGGDAVLRHVGAVLQRELRADDVAARLGGEEFGVLLPGAGHEAAMAIAERLRQAIARMATVYQERSVAVTASFGVVAYPEHGRTAGELVERADGALYDAKRAGRNRVCAPEPG